MAKYNRAFLVPYLRDVCSAEMLCSKLSEEINACEGTITRVRKALNQQTASPKIPEKKQFKKESGGAAPFIFLAVIAVLVGFAGMWLRSSKLARFLNLEALITVVSYLVWAFAAFLVVLALGEIRDQRKAREEHYQQACDAYSNQMRKNEEIIRARPKHELSLKQANESLAVLKGRLQEAKTLRKNLYQVNIIPGKYRDIYVAYYLYDYFNTSREDDLDKIIQTLLLDEIRQKLVEVVRQNEQILLNQRMQIALAVESNRMQEKQHREQMERLIHMEKNQERQMDYQDMLARNQEVTNYFLAADYIRKYY